MNTSIWLCATLLFTLAMGSSSLWACSIGYCGPNAQMLGNYQVPATTPVLVFGPRHCYFFEETEEEINDEGIPYDINLTKSTVRLIDQNTNTPIDVSIMPSPHREHAYYVIPTQLQPNATYKIELDLPRRAYGEAETWSRTFKTTQAQALPDASLSLGVDVATPQWKEYRRYSGVEADCSPYEDYKRYERWISGTIPMALEPWKETLVWRIEVDGQWAPLSAFDIQGKPKVLIHRSCQRGDTQNKPNTTYRFEAFIPGTQLSWRSNTVSVSLDCPPEDPMMADMGNADDMGTMSDMSSDMADLSGPPPSDMSQTMDMTDMRTDMRTDMQTQELNPSESSNGCGVSAQRLRPHPTPVILMILGMMLVSLGRRRMSSTDE